MEIIVQTIILLASCVTISFLSTIKPYRKWGFVAGTFMQPFWVYTSYINNQWGIFIVSLYFWFIYGQGIYNYFIINNKIRKDENMFFIKKNKEGNLEIYFELFVIDEKRKKCHAFSDLPTVVTATSDQITKQQINKEAISVLRKKMDKCLKDLEYSVKNQIDKEYLLRVETTRERDYEMTNCLEWCK